jgi:hypothetical protein
MTHEQATIRCEQLNREAPGDRRWFVSRAGTEEWHVLSVSTPEVGPLHASVESRPAPQDPPDPRPSLMRNIPPYGA